MKQAEKTKRSHEIPSPAPIAEEAHDWTPRIGTPHHDGDLGHNSVVYYTDDPYLTSDGERFTVESVGISDKMVGHVTLIPKEALSLLDWLTQEKDRLEVLAKEQES